MRTLKITALAVIAAVTAIALSQAIATAQDSGIAKMPEAEQVAMPDGPGNCGNVRACVFSNQDFNGTQSDWGVPESAGTGGTAWTYTYQEIRSAKNNFANRKVLLALDSSGASTYCIPASQNRQGPFNPTRYWIRIGQSGSTC